MMRTFRTDEIDFDTLTPEENDYIYNGLDCLMTHEIVDKLQPLLDKNTTQIYRFTRALLNPALEMTFRGIAIDPRRRQILIAELEKKQAEVGGLLNELALAFWGQELNAQSPKQCCDFFYGFLGCPPQYKRGSKGPSSDDKALEKLRVYFYARPFIYLIKEFRDIGKKLSSLRARTSPDGRMRGSFKPTGTETGRFSSSADGFGDGLNLQNQNEHAKRMYVADPGKKLAYIDLEQAESRMLAAFIYALFGDSSYLDACESGDLHTTVCKMIWNDLQWPGDNASGDRAVADQIFYRHFSYRDMSKRGGHGTNYYGKAPHMASQLNVPVELMLRFQNEYFRAFPGIPEYHDWIIYTLQTSRTLVNPFGRKRIFFGRPSDDSTLREAIAHMPQSSIGDLMNLGMWKVWHKFGRGSFDLLAQVHDAILIQYPEHREDQIIPALLAEIPHPLKARDRQVIIPCTADVGWNWSKHDPKKKLWADTNPDGLMEYSGHDKRKRTETGSATNQLLDFRLSDISRIRRNG